MVLRLRGGGGGPTPEQAALGIAPGGLIKQCILEDTYPAKIWERDHTICFNVQILNSTMFQQVTGKKPPSTPISAKTYADAGFPFYKIYGEISTVKGDFDGIKSVKQLDKLKNGNGKRGKQGHDVIKAKKKKLKNAGGEVDEKLDKDENDSSDEDGDGEEEQALQSRIIMLNPSGSATGVFTPVSELIEKLSRMKLRKQT